MPSLPQDHWPDATLPLLRDPYRHILARTRSLGTKGFRSRFLGKPAVFLTGAEAARLVYGSGQFRREGAVPALARDVLFGRGGVQGLDGAAHRHRKRLFLDLMGPEADLATVETLFKDHLRNSSRTWRDKADLFTATTHALAKTALDWAGVPVAPDETGQVADRLAALFLHAGSGAVGQAEGRLARRKLERDLAGVIDRIRAGQIDPGPGAAAMRVAVWTDAHGVHMSREVAAVELLNILRPIVAIAVYLVFLGHALARQPAMHDRIADDPAFRHAFAQEVRRLYPFFPATAAIAACDLSWQGETITGGTRVILDLYGTNREADNWPDADSFDPGRFLNWPGDPFTLVPQGGGDHAATHRCPGEWLTIRLMESFANTLASAHLRIGDAGSEPDYSALPALPKAPVTLCAPDRPA